MYISIYDRINSRTHQGLEISWDELCDLFRCASKESIRLREGKSEHYCFLPGPVNGIRRAENVEYLTFGSYDVDTPPNDANYVPFSVMRERLSALNHNYILYTTTKSTVTHNRYRIMVPFNSRVYPDNQFQTWKYMSEKLDVIFDQSTHDISRLSIFPARWQGAPCGRDGLPEPSWVDDDAHHDFAFYSDGFDWMVPEFDHQHTQTMSKVPKILSKKEYKRKNYYGEKNDEDLKKYINDRAEACPDRGSAGYNAFINPDMKIYSKNHIFKGPPGGRMYKFLCNCALRAFRDKIPISPNILHDLAQKVDEINHIVGRADLMREVYRAMIWAANTQKGNKN